MNKAEFLEILKDYLKKDFSESEVNDILRDYEEYFVDGFIEGKSDMEIIESLGSPKSIARELILQTKEKNNDNEEKIINTDLLNDKFSKFKLDMKKGYNILKEDAKEKYHKSKDNINDKLTPSIEEGVSGLSREAIKILLLILSACLIIPAFTFIIVIISVIAGLVSTLIAFIISIPFLFKFISMVPGIMTFSIFAIIAFIGFEILAWQILIFFIKLGKNLTNRYINWLKTKYIYINANKKMENLEKEALKDEDLYSDDYYSTKDTKEFDNINEYNQSLDDNKICEESDINEIYIKENINEIYEETHSIDDKKGEDRYE